MATLTRTLYRSSNGDQWRLVRETESGRVFVRHEANLPSGGRVTDLDVGDFLAAGPPGPQHQELLRLIGALVEAEGPTLGPEPEREIP
jgi:hypothetical protein